MDYYGNNGIIDSHKVVSSIKDINDKLQEERDEMRKTKLMYEMMLKGLYLQADPSAIL